MNANTEIIEIFDDDDDDVVEIIDETVDTAQSHRVVDEVKFKIHLNPVSLQRHRFTKKGGRVYNPSSSAQSKFRGAVKSQLSSTTFPLYPKDTPWL